MELKQAFYDKKNTRKTLLDAAKALILEGKTEEHKQKMAEIETLNAEIDAIEKTMAQEELFPMPPQLPADFIAPPAQTGEAAAIKAFAAAARNHFAVTKDMKEGVDADGGFTVPQDIVTRVETYRESKASLRDLVSVETVTTNKGRRTYKKRAQQLGFSKVAEGGKIPKSASPQFSILNYEISKYAGFMPVTNELLDDTDENIVNMMTQWIGDESRITDNTNILTVINKKAQTDLKDLDGIRQNLITGLDSAFRATSKIVTNANGVYWLSCLKDANERCLLNPIPSDPAKMQLALGAVIVPVVEYPNADLPNTAANKIPFILGDLKAAIKFFDRKHLTITSSEVAVAGEFNAFEQDMTLTKAILREDVQAMDADAYINGYIDTTPPVTPPKV